MDQGLPYYQAFVDRYPDVVALAGASLDEVLKLWQGLGYYTRARNLHRAARAIAASGGAFPASAAGLRQIPGIGPYTAAAVASFAFGEVVPVVDGNVNRVAARYAGMTDPVDTASGKRQVEQLIWQWIDRERPGLFNQAIMEFGALQCVPKSPDCAGCVLHAGCEACRRELVPELPVKAGKTRMRDRYFQYIDVRYSDVCYLHRREGKDIWQGLYELPLIETPGATEPDRLVDTPFWQKWLDRLHPVVSSSVYRCVHQLSHQKIHAAFIRVDVTEPFCADGLFPVSQCDLPHYAVSRLVDRYFRHLSGAGS